jgi:hypothetical protein
VFDHRPALPRQSSTRSTSRRPRRATTMRIGFDAWSIFAFDGVLKRIAVGG